MWGVGGDHARMFSNAARAERVMWVVSSCELMAEENFEQ